MAGRYQKDLRRKRHTIAVTKQPVKKYSEAMKVLYASLANAAKKVCYKRPINSPSKNPAFRNRFLRVYGS